MVNNRLHAKPCFNAQCNNKHLEFASVDHELVQVECPKCGTKGPVSENEYAAIAQWDNILRFDDFIHIDSYDNGKSFRYIALESSDANFPDRETARKAAINFIKLNFSRYNL